MRVLLAGLFAFGAMLGSVYLIGLFGPMALGGVHVAIPALVVLLLAIVIALWLFNPRHSNVLGLKSDEEHLRELEDAGLLVDQQFSARRAFGVSESEDEGLHYFIELDDGRVLFLSGQYLYDFEPIEDDPEVHQLRRFPCTRFTIRRHRNHGYVAAILCQGEVLEPEAVTPPFSLREIDRDLVPSDGEILDSISYEALRAARSASS